MRRALPIALILVSLNGCVGVHRARKSDPAISVKAAARYLLWLQDSPVYREEDLRHAASVVQDNAGLRLASIDNWLGSWVPLRQAVNHDLKRLETAGWIQDNDLATWSADTVGYDACMKAFSDPAACYRREYGRTDSSVFVADDHSRGKPKTPAAAKQR